MLKEDRVNTKCFGVVILKSKDGKKWFILNKKIAEEIGVKDKLLLLKDLRKLLREYDKKHCKNNTIKAPLKIEEYYKLPVKIAKKYFDTSNPFIRVVSKDGGKTYEVYSVQYEDDYFVPFKKKSRYSEIFRVKITKDQLDKVLQQAEKLIKKEKEIEEMYKKKKLQYYQSLPKKIDEFEINRKNGEVYDKYGNYICTIPFGYNKKKILDYILKHLDMI